MNLQKSFSADIYLELNKEFWQDFEIHCVAECCGIDAFDFSKEAIQETISYYDKEVIITNLDILIEEMQSSMFKDASSSIFNAYLKKEAFLKIIKEIKQNILS